MITTNVGEGEEEEEEEEEEEGAPSARLWPLFRPFRASLWLFVVEVGDSLLRIGDCGGDDDDDDEGTRSKCTRVQKSRGLKGPNRGLFA